MRPIFERETKRNRRQARTVKEFARTAWQQATDDKPVTAPRGKRWRALVTLTAATVALALIVTTPPALAWSHGSTSHASHRK